MKYFYTLELESYSVLLVTTGSVALYCASPLSFCTADVEENVVASSLSCLLSELLLS